LKFDPSAMGAYQGMMPAFGQNVAGWMQNPYASPAFQLSQQMGQRQAQNIGGAQMGNLLRNLQTSGLFGGGSASPAGLEMMQNQARANTGLGANLGFINPMQEALQRQMGAMNIASQFRPLQTGGKTTESTGGLGTWLPQLAGAAMGMIPGVGQGMQLGKMIGGAGVKALTGAPQSGGDPMMPAGGDLQPPSGGFDNLPMGTGSMGGFVPGMTGNTPTGNW
jgi:hypothetical protein